MAGEFIDRENAGEDWDVPASLTATSSEPQPAGHTLHWFTECGRPGSEQAWERVLLQGVIRFGELRIGRADSRRLPLEAFVADARRWWDALQRREGRLSGDAQQQARGGAASWRPWG